MSRSFCRVLAFLLIAAAAACAPVQPQPAPGAMSAPVDTAGLLPVAGMVYRDRMPFMGRDVPLPPGDWGLLSASSLAAKDRILLANVIMEQHQGSTVTRLISVLGPAPGAAGPTAGLQSTCQQGDVIDNRIRSADPTGEQDCLNVNFTLTSVMRSGIAASPANTPAAAFASSIFRVMFSQLDARNLVLPAVLIDGTVALALHGQTAFVSLLYNPDVDRVAPDPSPLRSVNGWARFNLDRDPAKKAYVARVLNETEAYRLRLIDMLNRPVAAPGAPRLRSASRPSLSPQPGAAG